MKEHGWRQPCSKGSLPGREGVRTQGAWGHHAQTGSCRPSQRIPISHHRIVRRERHPPRSAGTTGRNRPRAHAPRSPEGADRSQPPPTPPLTPATLLMHVPAVLTERFERERDTPRTPRPASRRLHAMYYDADRRHVAVVSHLVCCRSGGELPHALNDGEDAVGVELFVRKVHRAADPPANCIVISHVHHDGRGAVIKSMNQCVASKVEAVATRPAGPVGAWADGRDCGSAHGALLSVTCRCGCERGGGIEGCKVICRRCAIMQLERSASEDGRMRWLQGVRGGAGARREHERARPCAGCKGGSKALHSG